MKSAPGSGEYLSEFGDKGLCSLSGIDGTNYSVLHVRLESKSHEKLFVLVMCDIALSVIVKP